MHTIIYKIDNQQGPTIKHKGLYSISCNNCTFYIMYILHNVKVYIYIYALNHFAVLTEHCRSTKFNKNKNFFKCIKYHFPSTFF